MCPCKISLRESQYEPYSVSKIIYLSVSLWGLGKIFSSSINCSRINFNHCKFSAFYLTCDFLKSKRPSLFTSKSLPECGKLGKIRMLKTANRLSLLRWLTLKLSELDSDRTIFIQFSILFFVFADNEHRFMEKNQRLTKYAPKDWGKELKRRVSYYLVKSMFEIVRSHHLMYPCKRRAGKCK